MDEIVDRVGKLEGNMGLVQEDVAEMRPVTDDVKKWRTMGIGALGVVGLGGTALGASIVGFFDQLVKLVHR